MLFRSKLKMGVIGVTVEIMDRDSRLPADIEILGKTEASEKLPDIFAPKDEAVEAIETIEEVAEETVAEEVVAEEAVEQPAEVAEATDAETEAQ